MGVAFSANGISILLPDTEIVSSGIGIDCAHVVQFTAHFADFDLLDHFAFLC